MCRIFMMLGGQLLKGIQAFYREANAWKWKGSSVRVLQWRGGVGRKKKRRREKENEWEKKRRKEVRRERMGRKKGRAAE